MANNFLTAMFHDAQAQDTYDSYLAGLGWSLSKSSSGFTLTCGGYSDRLSDLALKLLADFCSVNSADETSFLKDSHFRTTKDKIVRGLKSYFESRRADSLAQYYLNLLMSSKSQGIEKNLELAEAMSLDDVVKQHQSIWADGNLMIEVFYNGNISERDATTFFTQATNIVERTQSKHAPAKQMNDSSSWVPGPFERRLPPGEDLELHFTSLNPKEGEKWSI